MRVKANWFDVDTANEYNVHWMIFNKVIHVRNGLEEVSIDGFFVQGCVWCYIISEFFNFKVDSLFGEDWFNLLQDFRMWYRGCTNYEFGIGGSGGAAAR